MIGRPSSSLGERDRRFSSSCTSHHGTSIIGFTGLSLWKYSLSLFLSSNPTYRGYPYKPYSPLHTYIPFSLIHERALSMDVRDDRHIYICVRACKSRPSRLSNTRPDVTKVHCRPRIVEQSNSLRVSSLARQQVERQRAREREGMPRCFNRPRYIIYLYTIYVHTHAHTHT